MGCYPYPLLHFSCRLRGAGTNKCTAKPPAQFQWPDITTPRALSLRNLVSGFECRRVFPAGVRPGSTSRDAVNWLPSRLSLSVQTRRRYGWLRMVFPGARLFRAPIWCSSGGWRHARRREHCRGEPRSALSGGYAPHSTKAEGSSIVDEPGED